MTIETWTCIALMFGALSCGFAAGWALRGYRFAARDPEHVRSSAFMQGWHDCRAHALACIREPVSNVELRAPEEVHDILVHRVGRVLS